MCVSITDKINRDIAAVNALLHEKINGKSAIFDDFVKPLVNARGKQLRARLCLHIALSNNIENVDRIKVAAAIEFLHLATLIHDDVIDEANKRRGVETIHVKNGNKTAILSGDYLFAKSFDLIGDTENVEFLKIFTKVIIDLVEGEFMQMADVAKLEQSIEDYLLKTQKKTANLIEVAVELGAKMAGYSPEEITHFKNYGQALGMLFQITDDLLDYNSVIELAGKPVGNDLKEGVLTYPLLSIKNSENITYLKSEIKDIIDGKSPQNLIDYVKKQGGINNTIKLAQEYEMKAKHALDNLPQFEGKALLYDNLNNLMHRTK